MNKPNQKREIKIADNIPGAEYANMAQISHNPEEFQLMFINMMAGTGRTTGKIITSPGHFKRMVTAMQENLKKYEEAHGEIKTANPPAGKEIGFNV